MQWKGGNSMPSSGPYQQAQLYETSNHSKQIGHHQHSYHNNYEVSSHEINHQPQSYESKRQPQSYAIEHKPQLYESKHRPKSNEKRQSLGSSHQPLRSSHQPLRSSHQPLRSRRQPLRNLSNKNHLAPITKQLSVNESPAALGNASAKAQEPTEVHSSMYVVPY